MKASITPFLSLTFLIIMSFIFSMLQLADYRTTTSDQRRIMELAMFSVFGEYQRELYNTYGIFAFDGAYHGVGYDEENVLKRLNYYGSYGIESDIKTLQLLTDHKGQALKEQIVASMEAVYGINYVDDLIDMSKDWGQIELEGEQLQASDKEGNKTIEDLLNQNEEYELAEADNPLPEVNKLKKSPLLSLVLPKGTTQSNLRVSLDSQVSNRTLRQGYGEVPTRGNVNSLYSYAAIHEFTMKYFTHALSDGEDNSDEETNNETNTESKEKRSLLYEIEYIIAGKDTDYKNLSHVMTILLFMRLAVNYAHIQSCKEKKSQAETLAALLTIKAPSAKSAVQQALIASWAFAESIMDLRTLMNGYKVAMIKKEEHWQLKLSNIGKLVSSNQGSNKDQKGGFTYDMYLRGLLILNNQDRTFARLMDRIEENIKVKEGQENFRLDAMIYRIHLDNTSRHAFGTEYKFPTQYGYR